MLAKTSRTALMALAVLMYTAPLSGQSLSKGFDALEIHDYFKARSIFMKHTRKRPVAAWYGLSVITGRDNNPFHQLDSAYTYIQRAELAYRLMSQKDRDRTAALGVDEETIGAQFERIHAMAWDRTVREHTIEAYERFMSTYITSARVAEAELIRNHLAFQEARASDSAEDYRLFIERHPGAREVYEARSRMQAALFREHTAAGDLESYQRFIDEHPESPYVRDAEEQVFLLSTPGRTVDEYRKFIQRHPRNHRVPDAWRSIYELYTRDLSVGNITQFLAEFPDYPFYEELAEDFRTARMVLHPFRRNELWGFLDEQGVERIKAEYDWVEDFVGGQALVSRNGRVGTINRSGREVVPVIYEDVHEHVEGTATVEARGKAGAVDRSGELVVPLEFDEVGEFSDGLAYASRNGRYGFIDARGNEVITFTYTSAGSFRNGLAVVEMESGFGVIDRKGNVIVPMEYDWVEGYQQAVSRMRLNGRFGLLSPFGDVLAEPVHEHIGPFRDGPALVVNGNKCWYMDRSGQRAFAQEYEAGDGVRNWGDFLEGKARVQLRNKRCLIDSLGRTILSCQYADIAEPTGPLVAVKTRNKWGFAGYDDKMVVPAKYDMAWHMHAGQALVRNAALHGVIDSTGKEVVPVRFQGLSGPHEGRFIATDVDGSGVIDAAGEPIIDLRHDDVQYIGNGLVRLERAERWAYARLKDGGFIWKEEGFDIDAAPAD